MVLLKLTRICQCRYCRWRCGSDRARVGYLVGVRDEWCAIILLRVSEACPSWQLRRWLLASANLRGLIVLHMQQYILWRGARKLSHKGQAKVFRTRKLAHRLTPRGPSPPAQQLESATSSSWAQAQTNAAAALPQHEIDDPLGLRMLCPVQSSSRHKAEPARPGRMQTPWTPRQHWTSAHANAILSRAGAWRPWEHHG